PAQRFQTPNELLKVVPTITGAIDARRRITRQSVQKAPSIASRVGPRRAQTRVGPKKISIARLPITGSDLFGREEDIAFLDAAWANQDVNIVTIVAWAAWGSLRWLTIGLVGWRRNSIDPRSSFLAGPFTCRVAVGALRRQI